MTDRTCETLLADPRVAVLMLIVAVWTVPDVSVHPITPATVPVAATYAFKAWVIL